MSDYTLISELVNPRLTTVKLPHAEIGTIAASLLIEQIIGAQKEKKANKIHQSNDRPNGGIL